jgi:hypothetical protein
VNDVHTSGDYRCPWVHLDILRHAFPDVPFGDTFFSYQGVHVFRFGAYGETTVVGFGTLDGALEDAAENAPKGAFIAPSEIDRLVAGARAELGPYADEGDIWDLATADTTYTESGYLIAWEWACQEVDGPVALARALGAE